jgi:hypothetical protein
MEKCPTLLAVWRKKEPTLPKVMSFLALKAFQKNLDGYLLKELGEELLHCMLKFQACFEKKLSKDEN